MKCLQHHHPQAAPTKSWEGCVEGEAAAGQHTPVQDVSLAQAEGAAKAHLAAAGHTAAQA